jgi:DNA polymerase-3 subunit epsilon
MTRGQNSFSIDLGAGHEDADGGGAALELLPLAEIVVRAASAEELAEHELLLNGLDKDAKGACIWRQPAADAVENPPQN